MDSREGFNGGPPALEAAIHDAAAAGRISCTEAFRIAGERGVSVEEVGRAVQRLGLKIEHCQLGCF